MSNRFSRDFKGIWIPKELWFDQRLSCFEKILVAEIDSLDCEKDHCFASNEYFSSFFNTRERTIREALSKLKKLGFIEQISFDGRTRILKSNLKTIYVKFEGSDRQSPENNEGRKTSQEKFEGSDRSKTAGLIGKNSPVSSIGDFIEADNIDYNKDKKEETTPNPLKGEVVSFGKFVSLKEEEFVHLCAQFGKDLILQLIEEINDYLSSTGKKPYKDYAATIRNWLRKRKTEKNSSTESEGDNRSWWREMAKILKPYFNEGKFYESSSYVEFSVRGNSPEKVYFKDKNFKKISENFLRKLEIIFYNQ